MLGRPALGIQGECSLCPSKAAIGHQREWLSAAFILAGSSGRLVDQQRQRISSVGGRHSTPEVTQSQLQAGRGRCVQRTSLPPPFASCAIRCQLLSSWRSLLVSFAT